MDRIPHAGQGQGRDRAVREGGPQDISRPYQPGGPLPLLPPWPHGGPGSQGLESGKKSSPPDGLRCGRVSFRAARLRFPGPQALPCPPAPPPCQSVSESHSANRTPNRLAAGLAALPVAAAVAPQQPRVGSPVCQGSLRPRACGAAQDTEPTDSPCMPGRVLPARWPPPCPPSPRRRAAEGQGRCSFSP